MNCFCYYTTLKYIFSNKSKQVFVKNLEALLTLAKYQSQKTTKKNAALHNTLHIFTCYLASSTALVSRITFTFICPG